jgi:hypothetical protein
MPPYPAVTGFQPIVAMLSAANSTKSTSVAPIQPSSADSGVPIVTPTQPAPAGETARSVRVHPRERTTARNAGSRIALPAMKRARRVERGRSSQPKSAAPATAGSRMNSGRPPPRTE